MGIQVSETERGSELEWILGQRKLYHRTGPPNIDIACGRRIRLTWSAAMVIGAEETPFPQAPTWQYR